MSPAAVLLLMKLFEGLYILCCVTLATHNSLLICLLIVNSQDLVGWISRKSCCKFDRSYTWPDLLKFCRILDLSELGPKSGTWWSLSHCHRLGQDWQTITV